MAEAPRDEKTLPPPTPPEKGAAESPGEADAAGAGDAARKFPPADFVHLVSGLATEVLVHLGAMPSPLTGKREIDRRAATFTLDLLAMLQEKTKGNRTPEEEQYLGAALQNLRLLYVRTAREPAAEEQAPPGPGAAGTAGTAGAG